MIDKTDPTPEQPMSVRESFSIWQTIVGACEFDDLDESDQHRWIRAMEVHTSHVTADLRQQLAAKEKEKIAPVEGYSAGIPWSMHLRAYDAYCKKYSPQQALIEGWCRGGFSTSELDMFIPGWREELSQMTALLTRAESAESDLASAKLVNDELSQPDPLVEALVGAAKKLMISSRGYDKLLRYSDTVEDAINAYEAAKGEKND